ncbi:hypothetical protein Tco_0449943 [Tanacetum coccineum]
MILGSLKKFKKRIPEELKPRKDVLPSTITANLEDVFSSNFPNYVPLVSSDYVPTSPGKTYSSASNLFGIAPLTSPTLLLFPDDPYMKALQASYTEKSPIPPPSGSLSIVLPNQHISFPFKRRIVWKLLQGYTSKKSLPDMGANFYPSGSFCHFTSRESK